MADAPAIAMPTAPHDQPFPPCPEGAAAQPPPEWLPLVDPPALPALPVTPPDPVAVPDVTSA
jgi:hypothetical protein